MTKLTILAAALAACSNEAPLSGHACPCGDGYVCCTTNVCVPEGEACSVVDPGTVDRGNLPCGGDEDKLADGTVDTRWTYTYDANGLDIHDEGDDGLDGTIDETYDQTYDEAGQLLLVVWKQPAMVDDWRLSMTYDALERKSSEVDEFGDGSPPYRETWTYDGATAIRDIDWESDGVIDERTTFVEDASGKPITGTVVQLPDNTPAGSYVYTYDAAGHQTRRDRLDANGALVERFDRSYNSDENLTHQVLTRYPTGTVIVEDTLTYDDRGRQLTSLGQFPPEAPTLLTLRYCD
jgi:serralysin